MTRSSIAVVLLVVTGKVFRRDVLERLTLKEDRFGFEQKVTAKAVKLGSPGKTASGASGASFAIHGLPDLRAVPPWA